MKKVFLSFLLLTTLGFCQKVLAQSHIFIKAVGATGMGANGEFDGGSSVRGHENEIEAYAYSDALAGCAQAARNTGNSACKVSDSPFSISIPLSFAVNSFRYNLLNGRVLTSVDMDITKSTGDGSVSIYRVHMENVLVSSLSEGGSSGDKPTFNIDLVPQKIAWQIVAQKDDGSAGASFAYGWDFSTNRAFNYNFAVRD